MITYIGGRLAAIAPTLLIVSFVTFSLLELTPGDTAVSIAGEGATEAQIEAIRLALGLDDPFLVRYFDFLTNALQGDLGESLMNSQPVMSAILERLPVTISLVAFVFVISVVLGVPAGALAARHPNSWIDRAISVVSAFALAAPTFLIGLLLIVVVSLEWGLLPATGYSPMGDGLGEWASRLVLPATAVALHPAAELARMTRATMTDTLEKDYIRTARAKGLAEGVVVRKHALKNAAIPVVTALGMQVARVLGGSVIIEQIFAIPGLGSLTIRSVLDRDLSMIMGIVIVAATITVLINLLVDLSYGYFNPKLRK
ncbi:ABC transporter permease [Nocardioides sp. zg-578]|uniref:ABC transporter permease subunit n=1 Tax=Nocardioides marmotae TaxID=2663857 RepID=A0A6I3IYV9_9ACTN|nr:ABC transporter permease [Nocardioides marmotae]MCR6030259.1 ABC transporter permease subunit [Gordonia jinghuaiqii]MTB85550.1 ABC transporter permease subunit [Nocardioides marmotae]MTB93891.1 ABC transporter permease subunit [Nocardioides marmotae]QKE03322.1 ABC transporter permease [Nocardioides marmotae]